MEKIERTALVLELIRMLKERGSWCGETHIQKAVYFLQEMMQVRLGFEYIMYKHGPYSFELADELTHHRADRMLTLIPRGDYGPSMMVNEDNRYIQKLFRDTSSFLDLYRQRLEFVSEKLADKKVVELERLATALYVTKENPEQSVEERARRINELKPHVSLTEAKKAVEHIDEMKREVALG
jgi:uncharacterized protein YwgA